MLIKNLRIMFLISCLVYLLLPLLDCQACNIPVFRYALERWPADIFEVVVFHRGKLAPEAQAAVDLLKKVSYDDRADGNYAVRLVDLDSEVEASDQELWEAQKDAKPPWMVVRYPVRSGIELSAWSSPLKMNAVKALLDSPTRRKVVKHILDGEAAVWILLESGDQEKDDKAAALLENQLKELEKTLELPPADDYYEENEGDDGVKEQGVAFSTLRLSRNDAKERTLISMLLNTEDDLRTFSEPIAFPIFGRGRVLYALVGKGISEDNILETCSFLVGPCSCQAKELNPGIDLVFYINWDNALFGMGEETPPLLADLPNPAPQTTVAASRARQSDKNKETTSELESVLLRNTILVLGVGLAIMAVAAVIILKRNRG